MLPIDIGKNRFQFLPALPESVLGDNIPGSGNDMNFYLLSLSDNLCEYLGRTF